MTHLYIVASLAALTALSWLLLGPPVGLGVAATVFGIAAIYMSDVEAQTKGVATGGSRDAQTDEIAARGPVER